ncbi:MAG: hypothetical protein IJT97_09525 [Bacteroidaceae bacterium]|nr:hypothetical protein [Bacteroidaceae bacterium]
MRRNLIFCLCLLTSLLANARKWSDDIITLGIGGGINSTCAMNATYNDKLYTSQFSGHNVMPDFHVVLFGVQVNYSSNFAHAPMGASGSRNEISKDHVRYTVCTLGYLFPILSTKDSNEKHMSSFSLYVSPIIGIKRRAQLYCDTRKTAFTDTYAVFGGGIGVRYKHIYLLGNVTNRGFGVGAGVAF